MCCSQTASFADSDDHRRVGLCTLIWWSELRGANLQEGARYDGGA